MLIVRLKNHYCFLFDVLALTVVMVVVLPEYCSVSHFVTCKIKQKIKLSQNQKKKKTMACQDRLMVVFGTK